MTSPIEGIASVAAVSVGDLVTANQADALATVTRLDPIEVDMYEPSARMLSVRRDIREGRLNPKEIITHRVPLEEVADAYHIFSSKLDNCIKTVLIPPSAREVQAVNASALH